MSTHSEILILGGYGNTGRVLARLLLQETSVRLVLAGRSLTRAREYADELNSRFTGGRVRALYADVARSETLVAALTGVRMLVVAASVADLAGQVAEAALATGVDYMDVLFGARKLASLRALEARIDAAGRLFITDGGFHPGLPAALVRAVAPQFDQLLAARVGSVIKINWAALRFSESTMSEFVSEFADFRPLAFEGGSWQRASKWRMFAPTTMTFGAPFDRQYVLPMFLEEMLALPLLYAGLRETGFYVSGFNWFSDWLAAPVVLAGLMLSPRRGQRALGRLFTWSLQRFSRPPFGTQLKLEARGLHNGRWRAIDLTVSHADGYFLTAAPVAACLCQYLDGGLPASGLHLQAHVVAPQRLLEDIARMGVVVQRKFV